jgi:hypothetical protein
MKPVATIACAVAMIAVWCSAASASSCSMPDVFDGLERARAVFIGTVEDTHEPRIAKKVPGFVQRAYTITFKIERSWKGQPFGYIDVLALQGPEATGLWHIEKGERYLVFAEPFLIDDKPTGHLTINYESAKEDPFFPDAIIFNSCTRTALLPPEPIDQQPWSSLLNLRQQDPWKDIRTLDSLALLPHRKVGRQ